MSRFLRFCVEETLAGRASELKEFTLGLGVFDRPPDFDPRTDPIVRVEARRLRDKLATYYRSDGASDDLVLELPKGGYAPRLRVLRPENTAGSRTPAAPSESRSIRLAVLPFENLTTNRTGDDYFSEGLSEELIHLLTRIPGLEVIAWTTSARLAATGSDHAAQSMFERLDLQYYIRGAVRTAAGNQVRVSVQLVELPASRYVWSEVYERAVGDLLSMESEIAQAIAARLQVSFTIPKRRLPPPAHGSEEHSLYLMGRFHTNRRTAEGMAKAVECYERAISMRPDFALAYAGLSEAYSLLAVYGAKAPGETVPQARAAAMRALELDADEAGASANASLGLIVGMHDWNWAEAEQLYRKALACDPNYATAHHWIATDLLCALGRLDEAMHHAMIARRLDPLSQIIAEGPGFVSLLRRDFLVALQHYQSLIDFDPLFYMVHTSMGRIYTQMGRYDEAVEVLRKGRKLAGDLAFRVDGALGQALALSGRTNEAREVLLRLHERSREVFVPSTAKAIIHLGLGEHDTALDYLEKAVDLHEFSVGLAKIHPIYDPVRHTARFQALLRRMNLLP
jgi:TolB-like protein